MEGKSKTANICGKEIKLGDFVKVKYTSGNQFKGATIKGKIIELWTPEIDNGHLQARVSNGWCFHNNDEILEHIKA